MKLADFDMLCFEVKSVNALYFSGRFNVIKMTGVGVGDEAGTWLRSL